MSFELANPFRKDAPPRSAPPGGTPREWARLYVMAIVLFMVVATMIYMKKMVDSMNQKKAAATRALGPGELEYRVNPKPPGQGGPEAPAGTEKKQVPLLPVPPGEVTQFKELAAPFRDGMEKIEKETPEFITFLNVMANSVTGEGLSKAVRKGLTAEIAFQKPAEHRGEVLQCYGQLIQLYTERIDATTPDNREVVYLGVMTEYPTNRTVYFYMPERPADAATGKPIAFKAEMKKGHEFLRDWVEIEGVFLRQYVYPSQYEDDKGQTIYAKAAVLFVKNLRVVPKPQFNDPRGSFVFVVAGLGVVIAGIVVVAGVMSRKYGSGSLRMKMFHLKKQKGDKVVPPPSPEKQVLGDEIPKPPEPPSS